MGLIVTNSNPIMQRPSGRMELASKSRNRSLSTAAFVHRFASENHDNPGKTRERDCDLRGNAKSFARFHVKRVIGLVADGAGKSPLFLRRQRFALLFQPKTNEGSNTPCLVMSI